MSDGYIGVDFDATLATYDGWKGVGVLGDPIPFMTQRVLTWLTQGKEVKIFTARAANDNPEELAVDIKAIEDWCMKHLGTKLEVTCIKDQYMEEYWDDRAVRVVANTGIVSDGRDVVEPNVHAGDIGAVM